MKVLFISAFAVAVSQTCSDIQYGMNNDGTNLGQVEASSSADCCNQCSSTSGCAGWTYVTSNGECWLKSAVGGPRSDPSVDSGSVASEPVPTPAPVPSNGQCPGGSLEACIHQCPSATYSACVSSCQDCCVDGNCGSAPCGNNDGSDLSTCVSNCPSEGFGDCVACCQNKFAPSPSPPPSPAPLPCGDDDGSDLSHCVSNCPSDTFAECIDCCQNKFPDTPTPSPAPVPTTTTTTTTTTVAPCGDNDGNDLATCVGNCPSATFAACIACCQDKFPQEELELELVA